MQLVKATTKAQLKAIRTLYEEAFPDYEKKPFWMIRLKNKQGKTDIWYLEKDGVFAGLAITMNTKELVLLDYFAVDEKRRGKGLGSEALKALQTYYNGRRFFLEVESTYDECENAEQRKRRKQFYLKNNMTETKIMAKVFKTNMEVLGYGCQLDFPTYRFVYEYVYGKRIAENVIELPYPEKEV